MINEEYQLLLGEYDEQGGSSTYLKKSGNMEELEKRRKPLMELTSTMSAKDIIYNISYFYEQKRLDKEITDAAVL